MGNGRIEGGGSEVYDPTLGETTAGDTGSVAGGDGDDKALFVHTDEVNHQRRPGENTNIPGNRRDQPGSTAPGQGLLVRKQIDAELQHQSEDPFGARRAELLSVRETGSLGERDADVLKILLAWEHYPTDLQLRARGTELRLRQKFPGAEFGPELSRPERDELMAIDETRDEDSSTALMGQVQDFGSAHEAVFPGIGETEGFSQLMRQLEAAAQSGRPQSDEP